MSINCQRGAAILVSVVMLLVLVSLLCAYTVKVRLFEQRALLNEIRQRQAEYSAMSLLHLSLAEFTPASPQSFNNQLRNLAGIARGEHSLGLAEEERDGLRWQWLTLSAIGASQDNLLSRASGSAALISPIIKRLPAAALTCSEVIASDISLNIVANPDGAGKGVPLSVWQRLPAANDLNLRSCSHGENGAWGCDAALYSQPGNNSADVITDPNLPTDLLAFIFNLPSSQSQLMVQAANQSLSTCAQITAQMQGLIWIHDDCQLSVGQTIGSTQFPVMLVLRDVDLRMAEHSQIYGLVVSSRSAFNLFVPAIRGHTQARISGALLVDHAWSPGEGPMVIEYNEAVLARLQSMKSMQRQALIPASGRDF